MNPYASFLGDRDPVHIIERTPRTLSEIIAKLHAAGLEWRPAPGKWNAREILCHLADCEIAFAFRLRQTLAESHHVIQPFDQEKWSGRYGGLSASAAVNAFTSLRAWNIALISTTPTDAMSKPVTHPERGIMTFGVIIETMAGHDVNHLRQLEKIAAAFQPAT